jgi:hypothetical protein
VTEGQRQHLQGFAAQPPLLSNSRFSTMICGLTERIVRQIDAVFHRRQHAEFSAPV